MPNPFYQIKSTQKKKKKKKGEAIWAGEQVGGVVTYEVRGWVREAPCNGQNTYTILRDKF